MSTQTKKKQEKKPLTLAQRAGYAKRKLKNRDIDFLKDHRGKKVPVEYVPDIDLVKHFAAIEIIKEAQELAGQIAAFKGRVQEAGDELYEQLMDENEIRDRSVGGFTLSTFDKALKVIYAMDSVQEKIPEELKIAEANWEKFLEDEFGDDLKRVAWLIDLVDDLLHNNKEEVDLRQLGKLNRLAGKIQNKHYDAFLEHLNQAYDTRHTKRYEQFKRRNEQNEYESIVLTYSSLPPIIADDE
jgi:hypothetical protein